MTGTIRRAVLERGFAFIESEAGDVFLHASDLVDLPWDESIKYAQVRFDPEQTPKGLRARNVRRAGASRVRT